MVERGCAYIAGLLTGVILMVGAAGLLVAIPSPVQEVTTVDQIAEFSGVGRQTERIELPEGKYLLTDDDTAIYWRRIEGDCSVPLDDPTGMSDVRITFQRDPSIDPPYTGGTAEIESNGCIIEIDFGETDGGKWIAKIERLP